jgi:CRISPR/Cas system CMR subunit Cmr4 (Cas7 group RAMP superfamily)
MSKKWVRYSLTAEFLSDAHLGSGSGGGGIDALIARDRYDRPVIWASHVEGVLRDAARRLRGDEEAGKFCPRATYRRCNGSCKRSTHSAAGARMALVG